MQFNFTKQELLIAQSISKVSQQLNYPSYFVGGIVRDRLLGRPSKDVDVVCVGDGIRLAEAVGKDLDIQQAVVVFKRFGTAMIKFEDIELEFVGARKESYSIDSRKPDVSAGTLEDDQNRRDFTINAMAASLNADNFGKIIDPFNGIGDLESKTIKTPLDPDKTFSDDPLRMMRGIRFATQLGFNIDEITKEGIKRNSERLKIISAERITQELNKIILSDKPSIGFNLLSETNLLNIFFPEFEALRGVEVRNNQRHKDNYYHTLKVLDNLCEDSDDLWLRWAAILHDIAKPATKRFSKDHGWTFHGHEVVGARMVPKIFKRFKLPLDHKMKFVEKMVRLHLRPISLTKEDITDSAMRRLLFDAGEDLDELMLLCKADITSKNAQKVATIKANYKIVKQKLLEVEEKDQIRYWQPPISGDLIMETFKIKPSRTVGIIKDAIREAILDGDIPNDYDAAYAFMLEKAASLGLEITSN
ncbi:MAG: HD domain-containing protein [Saprospiraceae bacterium]|nr:CCA tRNA nucleotidyltransferase [Bacteroidia bacterium]NNE13822.1 HD domain-containing protein [Saprospiraceae bacterium]NNL92690.1 HD domain-containing protein [Saprospiraceae bacterium]